MSENTVGKVLKIHKSLIDSFKGYQVIFGFHGFGSVGYQVASHMIETMDTESFCYWGENSWYYKNNLESVLTVYRLEKEKIILVTTRVPIFVTSFANKQFWDELVEDILNWPCERYIILGGLKEETRQKQNTDWAAFVPTPVWTKNFGHKLTFAEKLSMIGPLSSLLTIGTSFQKPVLGLLAYCSLDEDTSAALYMIEQLSKLCNITIPQNNGLLRFDYSFLSIRSFSPESILDGNNDNDNDFDAYDIDDLL